jgi:hypothetical protein
MSNGATKYAIIKIPTDPNSAEWEEGVQIYFLDAEGKKVPGKDIKEIQHIKDQSVLESARFFSGNKVYSGHAMWHISNPTCVSHGNRTR